MKFELWSVLFLAMVISTNSARTDLDDCLDSYLKNKGKLPSGLDAVPVATSDKCNREVNKFNGEFRGRFVEYVEQNVNSASACILAEFDKLDVADFFLKEMFYLVSDISDEEKVTILKGVENETNAALSTIAEKCEVDLLKIKRAYEEGAEL